MVSKPVEEQKFEALQFRAGVTEKAEDKYIEAVPPGGFASHSIPRRRSESVQVLASLRFFC